MPTAEEWNDRFRRGEHSQLQPDAFVAGCADYWDLVPNRRGERLGADLACGSGRHAAYLAEQGFKVRAIDFATVGLEAAQRRATRLNLPIETECVDIEAPDFTLGAETLDAIVVVHFLHRPLFGVIRRALKPGGLVAYKAYSDDQLKLPGGPKNLAYMLKANELLGEFSDYRVLRYEERISGEGTAALLAQKPSASAS